MCKQRSIKYFLTILDHFLIIYWAYNSQDAVKYCKGKNYEQDILNDWQLELKEIHGKDDLKIPGVFVDSHFNWNDVSQKQIFFNQSKIFLYINIYYYIIYINI